jgi:hypothetical protein
MKQSGSGLTMSSLGPTSIRKIQPLVPLSDIVKDYKLPSAIVSAATTLGSSLAFNTMSLLLDGPEN